MNLLGWLLGGTLAHALVWQLWEARLQDWGEAVLAWITGRPPNQVTKNDPDGIPQQLYRAQGLQYNPLFIAAAAVRSFDKRHKASEILRFRRLTDWLANWAERGPDGMLFPYHFALPDLGLQPPWHSCLAQATALVAFAQRHTLEPEGPWLGWCVEILHTLEPGQGLALELEDGGLWFSEYPDTPKSFVLNGMAGTLLKLEAAGRLAGLEQATKLFQRGCQCYLRKLPEFDCHGFSYYSLDGTKASRNYHQIHLRQLRQLQALAPHPLLARYRRRWQRRDLLPVAAQLFHYPRCRRILAFVVSWGLFLLAAWLLRAAVCR